MKLNNNELGLFALGGLSEVGKNSYCLQYKDEIIIIDFGALFPDDSLLGVDLVINDMEYLKKNQEKIVGVFITHGHLDHIGGLSFLADNVDIPVIYANGLAEGLIRKQLGDKRTNKLMRTFNEDDHIKSKYFDVTFYRTNHSIPDSFAIVVKTPVGTVVHSGDFKFDFTPIGPETNFSKMTRIADKGVLCLLSDSTNALQSGFTMSEKQVGNSIKNLFDNLEGRVIVASFASNIHRVKQIIEASIEHGRKIGIFGRSMENTVKVGREMGYISAPDETFATPREIKNLRSDQITILCTGSQGEPLAALSRISSGTHNHISIIPGDTVIFSSSPIPGNKYSINQTMNKLFKLGANVIKNNPLTDTHTSGHAGRGEQLLLFSLLKPKHFMPIHGEYHMLHQHAKTAVEHGIPEENCHILANGEVLAFSKNSVRRAGKIPCDGIYVKGRSINDISNAVLRQRKHISENGILTVVVTINKRKKEIIGNPIVISRGFIYMKDNEEITTRIKNLSKDICASYIKEAKQFKADKLESNIQESITNLVFELTERSPQVIPVIKTI